jgi:aminotransferase
MESLAASRLPYSQIRVMFDAAKRMEKEGREVIHMEIGRPDFDTPPHIVEAAVKALHEGKHHYSQNAGIPELRWAVAEKFHSDYGLDYDPESEIVVTNGVAEGVYTAINALLDPGDQILIPDPVWIYYPLVPLMNFVEPVAYSLNGSDGFLPDPEEIAELITPRTRMIVLVSPSNPTGSMIDRERLAQIASLAEKHNLVVLSDEIYEKIVYQPARHVSISTLPGMKDRTLVLNGVSKFYSMTGWRIGFVCGPAALINPILRYHQYVVTSTNTFAQWGAVTALRGDQGPSEAMLKEFHRRRDYLYEALNSIPGFDCRQPQGAFYLFPSIKGTGLAGPELATLLLDIGGVATVAGDYFGRCGAGHLRLSYANSMDNLRKAVACIQDTVKDLPH